jgi:hypothetical protein
MSLGRRNYIVLGFMTYDRTYGRRTVALEIYFYNEVISFCSSAFNHASQYITCRIDGMLRYLLQTGALSLSKTHDIRFGVSRVSVSTRRRLYFRQILSPFI